MVKYKVLPDWLKKCDSLGYKISNWCKIVDEKNVSCILCQKNIFCGSKGFQAVTQHACTTMHKNNASQKLSSQQMQLKVLSSSENPQNSTQSASSQVQICYKNNDVLKAEIIWTLKCVQSNIAANVSTDIKHVLAAMVPHYITEHFQLSRTKLSYLITEALGPYFRNENLKEARKSYYSLLYDETTNKANKKELQFQLRYWSEAEKEIVCQHLQTVFIGHATADDIILHIDKVLNNAALSKSNLLMLGSDGPNVNKKVWNVMNRQLIEERGYGLIDIGTCNIHVVHNAFHKGLEEYGDTACELVLLIYHFFKKYPSRWEDYEKCQSKKDVPQHRFLKHVGNRWLTVGPAIQRILEQWKAIEEYLLNYIPVHDEKLIRTEKYK